MLWIFTQNKQSLINVHEVMVSGKKVVGVIYGSTLSDHKVLGKYHSEERASEILHTIFSEIEEWSGSVIVKFAMPEV
ncbi:hypothetical protein [Oceanobacillus manasiensis]|uniref:hypothetical protein n=1 Tax=Oceanobacillus manasiensis TaxID=586413 RepID=UPI0005AB1CD7|nr:hypothetical protein [Oceanobacillus manasiensis]